MANNGNNRLLEKYQKSLKESEERTRDALGHAHGAEKGRLEDKLTVLTNKLATLEQSYQEHLEELAATKKRLVEFKGDLPEDELNKALAAIGESNTTLADALLADVEAIEEACIARVAKAAYQRGHIAYDNIEYFRTFEHFEKAACLQPEEWEYQGWAGKLADQIGDYSKALPFKEEALRLAERDFPATDPRIATSLNNLALLYKTQGDYDKAEPLFRRVLEIEEKSLGKDHPTIGATLNNLAELYCTQGNYSQAEPLHLRALKIEEKSLGKDHLDVATTLNNLAELYESKGDYDKAELLYLRALDIREKALGKDHPDVTITLNNLAELYCTQGDYGKAEPLLLRALGIYGTALGKDHPTVATTLNNLAGLYESKSDYGRAESLLLQALVILKKSDLPPGHPTIKLVEKNLVALQRKTKNR